MKKLFCLLAFLSFGQAAFSQSSCTTLVCPGDVVYVGEKYKSGAVVKGINPHNGTVAVMSRRSYDLYEESLSDLYVTHGCLSGACVGDTAYKGNEYGSGATIEAINPHKGTVVVRSKRNYEIFVEHVTQIQITTTCALYGDDARSMKVFFPIKH